MTGKRKEYIPEILCSMHYVSVVGRLISSEAWPSRIFQDQAFPCSHSRAAIIPVLLRSMHTRDLMSRVFFVP